MPNLAISAVQPLDMTIKRFRSENGEILVVTDTYFKFGYTKKDYSKFLFRGNEYNKGRLVNAVVKYHVEHHPDITFSELKKVFPDSIQGSNFGVFDLTSKTKDIYDRWGHKRHYIKPDEIISLSDEDISTCLNCQKFFTSFSLRFLDS